MGDIQKTRKNCHVVYPSGLAFESQQRLGNTGALAQSVFKHDYNSQHEEVQNHETDFYFHEIKNEQANGNSNIVGDYQPCNFVQQTHFQSFLERGFV
jgi:hypothetical protein